jgi:CheY-like chemotaxis protein
MNVISKPNSGKPVIRQSSSEDDLSSILNKYQSTNAVVGPLLSAMAISESVIQSTGTATQPTITNPSNGSPSNGLLRKPRILVVDDEKNIRLTVQHSLMVANYEVESASDGAEGLKKFRAGQYDLVLMDLRMPQMNGIEMLREIREKDKHTAAIVITAYLTIDTRLEAFSLGVSDYIRKPFSPNDVREMVRRVLARVQLDTHTTDIAAASNDSATNLELAK